MKKAKGDENGDEEFDKEWAANDQNEADGGDKNGDKKPSNISDENGMCTVPVQFTYRVSSITLPRVNFWFVRR